MKIGDLVKTRDWIKPALWGVVITIKKKDVSRYSACGTMVIHRGA